MEEEIQSGSWSTIGLAVIALLIPIVGFIMMLSHARAGETRIEQRWRKSHGLIYWVLLPAIAGAMMLGGFTGALPKISSVIGLIVLSGAATISYAIKGRRDEGTKGLRD